MTEIDIQVCIFKYQILKLTIGKTSEEQEYQNKKECCRHIIQASRNKMILKDLQHISQNLNFLIESDC